MVFWFVVVPACMLIVWAINRAHNPYYEWESEWERERKRDKSRINKALKKREEKAAQAKRDFRSLPEKIQSDETVAQHFRNGLGVEETVIKTGLAPYDVLDHINYGEKSRKAFLKLPQEKRESHLTWEARGRLGGIQQEAERRKDSPVDVINYFYGK